MSDDSSAIKYLHETLAIQKAAFLKDQYPSVEERQARLHKLAGATVQFREKIRAALSSDFAAHPNGAADLMEVLGPSGRAMYDASKVEEWMKDEQCEVDSQTYGDATAYVRREPKGVVGCLVPFNFPFTLSLGPICEMLAAGNRVILKPSEFTPECSKVMKELINATFPRDLVDVVVGGVELGIEFSKLKYDHILYTGSPSVGKLVMAAAAKNLVPVTLELGGKCPTILTPGSVTDRNVEVIVGTKMLKNGQMCVTPDTTYVPRGDVDAFVKLSKKFFSETNKNYSTGVDSTGIITKRHLDRLVKMLGDAKAAGANVIQIEEGAELDEKTRRMPLSMVIDPADNLQLAQEEIFGPIMNIVPYDDLDAVLAKINAGERPLGLYIFSDDDATIEKVIRNTKSGGVSINSCAIQAAIGSMGFGGIGQSGMGRHGGKAGFDEFSNPKGIFKRSKGEDLMAVWRPPYGLAQGIADHVISQASAPKEAAQGAADAGVDVK